MRKSQIGFLGEPSKFAGFCECERSKDGFRGKSKLIRFLIPSLTFGAEKRFHNTRNHYGLVIFEWREDAEFGKGLGETARRT